MDELKFVPAHAFEFKSLNVFQSLLKFQTFQSLNSFKMFKPLKSFKTLSG
jgi:hypothetical protein